MLTRTGFEAKYVIRSTTCIESIPIAPIRMRDQQILEEEMDEGIEEKQGGNGY